MKPISNEDITVVILAGGKGRRMGGKDKGLLNFKDSALIQHVIEAVSRQSRQIMINANRNLDQYAAFGYPVIQDQSTDFQGPLAGFYSAMLAATTDYILTLPCDGPIIVDDYLAKMRQALNDSGADIIVASDGERMQPVYALIPRALQSSLAEFLSAGERKIDIWYSRHNVALADFSDVRERFFNINTQADQRRLDDERPAS